RGETDRACAARLSELLAEIHAHRPRIGAWWCDGDRGATATTTSAKEAARDGEVAAGGIAREALANRAGQAVVAARAGAATAGQDSLGDIETAARLRRSKRFARCRE